MQDQCREKAREGKFRKKAGEGDSGFRGKLGRGAQRMLGGQRPTGRDEPPVSQLS